MEIMTQLQMESGEKFPEIDRGGRIIRLGCVKKVEIALNFEGKTIPPLARKQIFPRPLRL
jgi:hypothetical protein